jgi:hypothetical protein
MQFDEPSVVVRSMFLADMVGADARPDTAGGEGGHVAAKLHPVIHRNIINR